MIWNDYILKVLEEAHKLVISQLFYRCKYFLLLGSIFKIFLFFSAVIILSSAAVMRIVAWQIYDADFATIFIIVEVISSIMILS